METEEHDEHKQEDDAYEAVRKVPMHAPAANENPKRSLCGQKPRGGNHLI